METYLYIMQIRVLIFGQLTDITGVSELHLSDVSDRDGLIAMLNRKYPALEGAKYAIAVDKKVASQNVSFTADATIALLPPFSGG